MIYSIAKKLNITFVKDIVQVILAALLLGLFTNICIPLFFTPVPIVLQNSISVAYGYFLKSKKAGLSILLFIILGIFGFPFFAKGSSGLSFLCNVTGGYIFGYAIAGYLVGKIFEKSSKNISLTILFGHLIILLCGWIWFSYFVGMPRAFVLGVLPFIPGDIFKSIVIVKLIKLYKFFYNQTNV
jgi:biotin transport system substrate-specific component